MKLNFLNLKNGQISHNSYRFADASVTTIEDIIDSANGSRETMVASFDNIDRSDQDRQTTYWFQYRDAVLGLCVSDRGDRVILNDEGYPLEGHLTVGLEILVEM